MLDWSQWGENYRKRRVSSGDTLDVHNASNRYENIVSDASRSYVATHLECNVEGPLNRNA